jgi:hypothetical protein
LVFYLSDTNRTHKNLGFYLSETNELTKTVERGEMNFFVPRISGLKPSRAQIELAHGLIQAGPFSCCALLVATPKCSPFVFIEL